MIALPAARRILLVQLIASVACCALLGAPTAWADTPTGSADTLYDWSGFYGGVNLGAAFGSYKATTTTDAGTYFGDFGAPFFFVPADVTALNAAGAQGINRMGFTGGLQLGENWQDDNLVLGIETDFNWLRMTGTAHSTAAFSNGVQFLESAYGNSSWLATLRPRVGFAADDGLFYVTGGLALANPSVDFIYTDSNGAIESAVRNSIEAGYAVGAGVEWAFSDQLSVKAEYLYTAFGGQSGHETASNIVPPFFVPEQGFGHSSSFNASLVRIGINYHFGSLDTLFDDSSSPTPAAELPDWLSDWEVDVGARVWASSGRIGAPDPLFNSEPVPFPNFMASRITFSGLGAVTGETYARFDHASGIFVKGFLGGGGIASGHQNDEDFPAFAVYSNTLSSASGSLAYANVDLGYSFLSSPSAKFGAFAGYNYYTEHVNTYGCVQLALDFFCGVPQRAPGLIQDDTYNSLRVGVTSEFIPDNRLKMTTEVAYVPWTDFSGSDDHNFRQLLLPEQSSGGDGVMLEASLDYLLTDAWSFGIGGRYWTWNMHNGAVAFEFLGIPPILNEPSLYNTERYGVFLQTDYHFGGRGDTIEEAADANAHAANWTGLYAGANLGAGVSDARWADPFGPTTFFGFTNAAGFGDSAHASGAIAGFRLGGNWEADEGWVIGLEGNGNWSNLRGQNTCFSGTGGVGCGEMVQSIYDVATREGVAWDRTFAYIKTGGAWVSSKYFILGDTPAFFFGTSNVTGDGTAKATRFGVLIGAGLEYAIDDQWSTRFDFDHIGSLKAHPQFPTVTVIGAAPLGVSQSVNMLNVGLSYKFY